MAKPVVTDELWEIIQPLLPPAKPRRKRYPGRKPIDDRKALTGILFILKTGTAWEDLPRELGCGSGMTCWRRLRDWQSGHFCTKPYSRSCTPNRNWIGRAHWWRSRPCGLFLGGPNWPQPRTCSRW